MTEQQTRRFKIFYTNGNGDFLRTSMGAIREFTDVEEAQATAARVGGMVLPWDAPAPGGFDRMWEP